LLWRSSCGLSGLERAPARRRLPLTEEPEPLSDSAGYVVYLFGTARRRPQTVEEIFKLPPVARQIGIANAFKATLPAGAAWEIIPAFSRSRKVSFVDHAGFAKAVDAAAAMGGILVLASIANLMAATRLDRMRPAFDALNATTAVPVLDAATRQIWGERSLAERSGDLDAAILNSKVKSQRIKAGIARSVTDRAPPRATNRSAAVSSVKRKADARARALSDFVECLGAQLPAGQALSPATLARALNDAGIPSPGGTTWSYNGAKNLIARQASLGTASDKP